MANKNKNIIIILLGIATALLLIRVVFDQKFDDFGRYVQERETYKGGPEEYDKNLEKMGEWFDNYKKEHPESTKEDAEEAWKEAWGQ